MRNENLFNFNEKEFLDIENIWMARVFHKRNSMSVKSIKISH